MQKKVRRTVPSITESLGSTSVISSESKHISGSERGSAESLKASSISNDNSKQGTPPALTTNAGNSFLPRPKVYMSPRNAAAKNLTARKKPTRYSAIPIHADAEAADKITSTFSYSSEKPTPVFTSPKLETSAANDASNNADELPVAIETSTIEAANKSGVFFDIKFAFGLIAIVVAVNLLLAMLVDKTENKQPLSVASTAVVAQPKIAASLPVKSAPVLEAVQAQGAVVSNSLSDIQPSAGQPATEVALPSALPVVAAKPAAQPDLGVVTTAADEKQQQQPKRNLLSIIDQY